MTEALGDQAEVRMPEVPTDVTDDDVETTAGLDEASAPDTSSAEQKPSPRPPESAVETTTIVSRATVDDWLLGMLDASESDDDHATSGRGPWPDDAASSAGISEVPDASITRRDETPGEVTSIVDRATVDDWLKNADATTGSTTAPTSWPTQVQAAAEPERFTYTRASSTGPQPRFETEVRPRSAAPPGPAPTPTVPPVTVPPALAPAVMAPPHIHSDTPPAPPRPVAQTSNWGSAPEAFRDGRGDFSRRPPARGWRKAVYLSSFKLVNPGPSPEETNEAELETMVRAPLRGRYRIGVLGKGGVGKSTITAAVGSMFATLRQGDSVVAVDADTAFGTLGSRIDPTARTSHWELAGAPPMPSFAELRAQVGRNAAGLCVLPGEANSTGRRILDPATYRAAVTQLDRFFTLTLIDCGSTVDAAVTVEALTDVDALIVVTSPWFDGASTAGQTMQWLAAGGRTELLNRTTVVINDSDGHAGKDDRRSLAEYFGRHGQRVIELPYDDYLRPGGVIEAVDSLNPLTRRRLLGLTASCAQHLSTVPGR